MGKISVLRFALFKDSEKPFLDLLDAEGIHHSRVLQYTQTPQASGIVEAVSALSEAMPWNSIAKIIIAWIESRKSRKIVMTLEGNRVLHAEGYSAEELSNILPQTLQIAVIDTKQISEEQKQTT